MTCSVIILNWNGEAMLRRYLPSVIQHTLCDGVELVVADNASTDSSIAYLQTQPAIRIIQLEQNYGFAEGYNRAISQVNSEYVVLLNSDVEVTDGWLDPLLSYMRTHAHVAAVQPKILSWQSKEDAIASGSDDVLFEHAGAAGGMIDCLGYPYCRGRFLTHLEADHGQYDQITPIFWASGACLLIRREIYLKEGGLDAKFFAHQEEIDLCWRLNSRGYSVVAVPQSSVYHLGGGALGYESPRKTFLNFRNNLLMLYKNLPTISLIVVFVVRFFMDYVAALQMLCAGKLSNAKAVVQARVAFWRMKREYVAIRKSNLSASVNAYPSLISKRSIIVDYYLLQKRK